jgi:hypothetical protein
MVRKVIAVRAIRSTHGKCKRQLKKPPEGGFQNTAAIVERIS